MLTAHVVVSVGWIGAVAAYIPLDVMAATSQDPPELRAAYLAMGWIASWVIVPLALSTVATGLVMALGTRWGLFRHYWVLISLVLTVVAALVLLAETRVISANAAVAGSPDASESEVLALGNTLVHSVGGLGILLVVLVLNTYKPKGLTSYGWRKASASRSA